MYGRQPQWKAADGYTVNQESGIAEKCGDRACTLHFYLAKPGDILHLLDKSYEYGVATYSLRVDSRYLYTYAYQPEESWTEYRHDFSDGRFTKEDYVFTEKVFFRVILRKAPGLNSQGISSSLTMPSPAGNEAREQGLPPSFCLAELLDWQAEGGTSGRRGRRAETRHQAEGSRSTPEGSGPLGALDGRNQLRDRERRIEAEIDDTVRHVKGQQPEGALNFFLLTDSHYTVNGTWDDTVCHLYRAGEALENQGVRMDGFIHLGDATDGMVPAEVTRDYITAMQEDIGRLGIPFYYVIGNHDSNYFGNNPERFSQEEIRQLYLQGREKCYYYKDYPVQRLRMVFLESFDPSEEARYGFREEELDWLEGLLAGTGPEWYVLVFSHVPPTPRLHYWSKEIRGSQRLLQILRHYQACGREAGYRGSPAGAAVPHSHLLGFIHGHNHADQVDYEEGFPIISIGCCKCEYFQDMKPEGAAACQRVPGEVSQDLWDILTVSASGGTLDFTRFGAGENRHIDLKGLEWAGNSLAAGCTGENEGTAGKGEKNAVCSQGVAGAGQAGNKELCAGKRQGRAGEGEPGNKGPYASNNRKERPMKKVITYGSFDLFHEGHYNILKRAKALGDYLIVGVTTEHYDEQRGKLNIVDPLLERIENVRRTGLVDEIIIEDHEGQKIEDVQKYDVDIFVLGSDWKGVYDYLKQYCQVAYLERTPDISSTMLRKAKYPIIRVGMVGSGRIAPRFLSEAKFVSGLNVQSVYNPNKESVESFAGKFFLDGYSGLYEEFLDKVDAVYIATPHETHYDYTRRALLAGKHVLCEKPMALTRSQAEELFALARERKLVLMEAIKTAFCPGFAQLVSVAKSGKIGEIRDVEACFSRLTPPHLREMVDTRYGGAFMEFGSYTVLPILKLLGLDYQDVKTKSIRAENGVDLYTKVYFEYADGMGTSKTGLGVKSEGQLLVSGTKGYILAESPWWLTRKFQVRYENPNQIETYTPNFQGDGLRYEIGEFTSRINGRGGHAFKLTEEESIAMADVVERFLGERDRQRAEAGHK